MIPAEKYYIYVVLYFAKTIYKFIYYFLLNIVIN